MSNFYEYKKGGHKVIVAGRSGAWRVMQVDGATVPALPHGDTRAKAIQAAMSHLRAQIDRHSHIGSLADLVAQDRRTLDAIEAASR